MFRLESLVRQASIPEDLLGSHIATFTGAKKSPEASDIVAISPFLTRHCCHKMQRQGQTRLASAVGTTIPSSFEFRRLPLHRSHLRRASMGGQPSAARRCCDEAQAPERTGQWQIASRGCASSSSLREPDTEVRT